MIRGLKRRIRAFLRAPEMEHELASLRNQVNESHAVIKVMRNDCHRWRSSFHDQEALCRKANEYAHKAREYAESQIPKEVVEWMQLCRHQDFPASQAVIFYPSDFMLPTARMVGEDYSEDGGEYRTIELARIDIRFMVNPASPAPCGLAARQLLEIIQQSIGEVVVQ